MLKTLYTKEQLAVAGKANCGCVYHAEEGIPCPHDLALLEQPVPEPPAESEAPQEPFTLDELIRNHG
mgnify:CR=1 FL=1